MTTFEDLRLASPLLDALEQAGHKTPTPIQAQAIPSVLDGRDLLGIAQTGTGKTAAFALPILNHLISNRRKAPRRGCRALVLSPTRELASQIADSFRQYGRFTDFSVATIFGGVGYRPQIQSLTRGVDILIATPGRLLDHISSGHAELSGTEIFVLDEADQMLDLGFLKPIKDIASRLATKRQMLFFSATMPREIADLANTFLNAPVKVSVTPQSTTVERIAQRLIHVDRPKKMSLLSEVLGVDGMHRALVFTRTKRGADRVAKHLAGKDFSATAIHGNKSQNQRDRALQDFKNSKVQVLVATDIAARGIDVDGVSHVINYDLPETPEAYVHRIGRTARAGAEGEAVSFCTPDEKGLLAAIEKLVRLRIPSENRRNDDTLAEAGDGQKDRRIKSTQSGRSHGANSEQRSAGRAGAGRGDERGRPKGRGVKNGRPARKKSTNAQSSELLAHSPGRDAPWAGNRIAASGDRREAAAEKSHNANPGRSRSAGEKPRRSSEAAPAAGGKPRPVAVQGGQSSGDRPRKMGKPANSSGARAAEGTDGARKSNKKRRSRRPAQRAAV